MRRSSTTTTQTRNRLQRSSCPPLTEEHRQAIRDLAGPLAKLSRTSDAKPK